MSKVVDGTKKFINKIKDITKKIKKGIVFLTTTLGQIVACGLLILVSILLIAVIVIELADKFGWLDTVAWNYSTYDQDLEIIKQLNDSGYERLVDAENFQDFNSFEYAVLMDAAEYIWNGKPEKYNLFIDETMVGAKGYIHPPYEYEREDVIRSEKHPYTRELFEKNRDKLSEKYANLEGGEEPTTLPLLDVQYTTDQSLLNDGVFNNLVMSTPGRNVDARKYDGGIIQNGVIRGGNNRVTQPEFGFDFVYKKLGYQKIENTNSQEESSSETEEQEVGYLEPYFYITRDKFEFTYYYNSEGIILNRAIVNVNNTDIEYNPDSSTDQRKKDFENVLYGVEPVVFIEDDPLLYEKVPYCKDINTATVYKIPLRVILGRYLPRHELLMAWSVLKDKVERQIDEKVPTVINSKDLGTDSVMDRALYAIKGLYNEACLDGEGMTTHTQMKEVNDAKEPKTYYYTEGTTHEKTFVEFAQFGIDSTKYALAGKEGYTGSISMALFAEELVDGYTLDQTIGYVTDDDEEGTVSLSELDLSALEPYSHNVLADGDNYHGYIPPYTVIPPPLTFTFREEERGTVQGLLEAAIAAYLGVGNVTVTSGIIKHPYFQINYPGVPVTNQMRVTQLRMPVVLVTKGSTWAKIFENENTITQNHFKQNDYHYALPKSVSSIGIENWVVKPKNLEYRSVAYAEIFHEVMEKDVINMLMEFENDGKAGVNDAYEFMRDLYILAIKAREYSAAQGYDKDNPRYIHEDTYMYVHVPDSVKRYNVYETQPIYWTEALTAIDEDALTNEELNNFRTKNAQLSWQKLEYDKYPECGGSVYALSPFGSGFARAYYEAMFIRGQDVKGGYSRGEHDGADWFGRTWVQSVRDRIDLGAAIYQYEYSRMAQTTSASTAEEKLRKVLDEESLNTPIVSIAPGYVTAVGYNARGGFYAYVTHSDTEGAASRYFHLKRWPLVNPGDFVGAGTLIGYQGNTGRSMGPHLHFEIDAMGTEKDSPKEYIFPSFNPFYNAEKAGEGEDYMSLYRTVRMADDPYAQGIMNRVPEKPLVRSTGALQIDLKEIAEKDEERSDEDWSKLLGNGSSDASRIEIVAINDWSGDNILDNIGKVNRVYRSGNDAGWKGNSMMTEAYNSYLHGQGIYDLYLLDAYFDESLANSEGYLTAISIIDSPGFIIKNGELGSVQEFSRVQVQELLNAVRPNLMLTDEELDVIMNLQRDYKINPVFMLALGITENLIGTGRAEDLDALRDFGIRIAGSEFFEAGKTGTNQIAEVLNNIEWGRQINGLIDTMLNSIGIKTGGNISFSNVNVDTLLGFAQKSMEYLVSNNTTYGYPTGHLGQKPYTEYPFHNKQMDCSSYVAWVVWQYANAMGNQEMVDIFNGAPLSVDGWWSIANQLSKNHTDGERARFFELVASNIPDKKVGAPEIPGGKIKNIQDTILQHGDIIIYESKTQFKDNGKPYRHVEIYSDQPGMAYSFGRAQTVMGPGEKVSRRDDAVAVIRLKR